MRIDAHTHIFPPEVVRDRNALFHCEPAFRLLYSSPRSRIAVADDLLRAMDEDEIDRSVTAGFPWQNGEQARKHNDYILESCAAHPDRIIPLACVDPLRPYAFQEAERCLDSGAAGLGEIAIYGSCTVEVGLHAMEGLVSLCRSKGSVLLVHANEPVGHSYPGKAPMGLEFFYQLAQMARGVTLILAHWGGGLGFYETLKKETRQVPAGVYYDTAASPFLYEPSIYALMCRIVGVEKILMGSDFPLLKPHRYREEMQAADLSEAQRKAMEGLNAARIFNLLPELDHKTAAKVTSTNMQRG